jgi:predicted DNA-binding protein
MKKRSPNQTTITISLPVELKIRIDAAAAKDSRTVSNWIVVQLELVLGSGPPAVGVVP